MRVAIIAVFAVLLLAGCVEKPTVPDGAQYVEDPDLPGVKLTAWVEGTADGVLLHGLLENVGDRPIDHRIECGHPWNSTIVGPEDSPVHPLIREPCNDFFYERLGPGKFLEFRQSWDFYDHSEESNPVRAPGGLYTWWLAAYTTHPDGALGAQVRFVVPHATTPQGHEARFSAGVGTTPDGFSLTGEVFNRGEADFVVNGACGSVSHRILDAWGRPIPLGPEPPCEAVNPETLAVGESMDYAFGWNKTQYDPVAGTWDRAPFGPYTWEVRLNPVEPSGFETSHRIRFEYSDEIHS